MRFLGFKKLEGTIHCVTGLHVGGTKDTIEIGGIDDPVIRNPITRLPYIPGSSLKGKLRCLLEWDIDGKLGQDEKIGFIHQFKDCKDIKCPICRIFGVTDDEAQFGPGRGIFRDSLLKEKQTHPKVEKLLAEGLWITEEKAETAIDRIKGKARGLRHYERVPAGMDFSFHIAYRVFDINDQGKVDKNNFEWLKHGLWLLQQDALGGCGSRGYGQIEFRDVKDETGAPVEIKDRYPEITGKKERV